MFEFYKDSNSMGNQMSIIDLMYANLQSFTTPGYKAADTTFEEMMTDGIGLGAFHQAKNINFTQGKVRKTGNTLDLALREGESGTPCSSFFVLSDGQRTRYTRAGHFNFKDGKLIDPFSHLRVQGYTLDENGNKKSTNLEDISLAFDPTTQLYGGMYTGFKFGDGGKLYGEVRLTDPLSKQAVSKTVPIFQIGLASFADPRSLAQVSSTTYETTELSGVPNTGVAGEGTLIAQVDTNSLEMSNVDIPTIAQNIVLARMAYDAQMSAFKVEIKMTETAAGLLK